MSVKVMGLVWDLDIERGRKYILLAYADHADHEGRSIFPAIETIAKKTGYDARSVKRITTYLEDDGYLVLDGGNRKGGPGKPTHWRIPIKGDKIAPIPKGDKKYKTRVTKSTNKGDTMSPDPSLKATVIIQPSDSSSPNGETPTPHHKLFEVLSQVTGMDYKAKRNAGRLAKATKEILGMNYTPKYVQENYQQGGWWYVNDWRGKKNQRPTLSQIIETLGQIKGDVYVPYVPTEAEKLAARNAKPLEVEDGF